MPLERAIQWLTTNLIKLTFRFFLTLFYREVDIIGTDNVPVDGPVIFVGNHQNQFVDAVMLFGYCSRDVGFLMAAKSYSRFIVGWFARLMHAIPVVRAQDVAKSGVGQLVELKDRVLIGKGTEFTKAVKEGDSIGWKIGKVEVLGLVGEVKDDTTIVLAKPVREENPFASPPYNFRVLPKVNHAEMYENVYTSLAAGRSVGIFPEGGSHDRTSMLPFKSGCAVFALGATQHGIRPKIVPFGLTYRHGHHFRSRAHLEFGVPLEISDEILAAYNEDSKKGISLLMAEITESVQDVTINYGSYEDSKIVHTARQLYIPRSISLSSEEYLLITRRLVQAYDLLREEPRVQALVEQLGAYQMLTESFWLVDAQVETIHQMKRVKNLGWLFLKSLMILLFYMALSLPGYVINLPIVLTAKAVASRQAALALAGSTVKVAGRDVMASYKIITMMSVGPILWTSLFIFFWIRGGFSTAVQYEAIAVIATYISLYSITETVLRFKAIIPFFLYITFKRYQRLFETLYIQRRQLEKAVRELVADFGPQLPDKIWSERAQELFGAIQRVEKRLQEEQLEHEMVEPFSARLYRRIKRPQAHSLAKKYTNSFIRGAMLGSCSDLDYYALPSLKSPSPSYASMDGLDKWAGYSPAGSPLLVDPRLSGVSWGSSPSFSNTRLPSSDASPTNSNENTPNKVSNAKSSPSKSEEEAQDSSLRKRLPASAEATE